jgi:hypothetical protein
MAYLTRTHRRPNLQVDRKVKFNRQVLTLLEAQSPDHAFMLNRHGSTFGWWYTLEYMFNQGQSPQDAADYVKSQSK